MIDVTADFYLSCGYILAGVAMPVMLEVLAGSLFGILLLIAGPVCRVSFSAGR
jgi:hypothetical protein